MCGIVGGICNDNITPFLIKGLKHLEYRGYDSAGLVLNSENQLKRFRAEGKVFNLEQKNFSIWNSTQRQYRNRTHQVGNTWHPF